MQTKLEWIKSYLQQNNDVVTKKIKIANINIELIFLQNMIDTISLNDFVIKPLMQLKSNNDSNEQLEKYLESLSNNYDKKFISKETYLNNKEGKFSQKIEQGQKEEFPNDSFSSYLNENCILVAETEYSSSEEKILEDILRGNVCLIIEDGVEMFKIALTKYLERTITEPPTSVVINGPRAGFVESLKVNVTLIRRILVNKDLVIKDFFIGRYTKTKVSVFYISSIANRKMVRNICKRISQIDIDGVLDTQYLVDNICEKPYSLFKQIGKFEKPDVVVAKMLEGRVAIMVDGSPICLTLPFMYLEDLQSSDDYYQKNYKIIMVRMIRILGSFMAMLIPGFYVALQQFHYKLIPIRFLVTIVNSTQGLPLTPFLEMLFVILLFEILYEASVRMPKYLGMALSIVGALILGDTAVKAGLISSPAVMIVALSGITIYTTPDQAGQLSLLRLFFVLIGGTIGIFGIIVGILFIIAYSCTIESYGVPYFAPVAPLIEDDLKDALIKKSSIDMVTRPKSISNKNVRRKK